MERRRPVGPCAAGRLPSVALLVLLGISLLVCATAQDVGSTSDVKACSVSCTKPCKKQKTGGLSCLTCKRGFARAASADTTCTVCAKNYATAIDPTMPLAVRRGFAACKKEPCGRCSVCPQGTTSAGGKLGATPFSNGTATCGFTLPAPTAVDAGYYWDPFARKQKLCPQGTFAANPRPVEKAGIESCLPCSGLFSFRYTTAVGTLQVAVADGVSDRKSCKCPENTYYTFDTDGANQKNWACVTCPTGSTGSAGSTKFSDCASKCRVGYYGDPTDPTYNYQCSQCPTASGASANSATDGVTLAPVPLADCDTCVFAASEIGSSAPAACSACPTGYWHGTDGAVCDFCASGFIPAGGACVACDTKKFAVNSAWKAVSKSSTTGTCGGCQAGLYGTDCTSTCATPASTVAGEVFVLLADPTTDISNCLYGCPAGTGFDGTKCSPCTGNTFSPGASPGFPRPVCQTCPGTSVAAATAGASGLLPAGNNRCTSPGSPAETQSLFDEFD